MAKKKGKIDGVGISIAFLYIAGIGVFVGSIECQGRFSDIFKGQVVQFKSFLQAGNSYCSLRSSRP